MGGSAAETILQPRDRLTGHPKSVSIAPPSSAGRETSAPGEGFNMPLRAGSLPKAETPYPDCGICGGSVSEANRARFCAGLHRKSRALTGLADAVAVPGGAEALSKAGDHGRRVGRLTTSPPAALAGMHPRRYLVRYVWSHALRQARQKLPGWRPHRSSNNLVAQLSPDPRPTAIWSVACPSH
jgi:hypothetical protein